MIQVIAEFGQSHGGSLDVAMMQATVAKDAGCTYAKWQTFQPERLVAPAAASYWDPALGGFTTQLDTFKGNGVLRDTDWKVLAQHCADIGIGSMSSPFDLEAVDLLVEAGVDAIKIASGEITHRQMLQRVAETGLPVVLSTGAATLFEVGTALTWLQPADVTLLACTLSYPCAEADAELARIATLARCFPNHRVGYSDHTLRTDTALAAVIAGATMLEKHCTLDADGGVPDDRMALDPPRLRRYVAAAELGARMLGTGHVRPTDAEQAARAGARRSLHAARDIPAGVRFSRGDFVCLRPAGEFNPSGVDQLVGLVADRNIPAGKQIEVADIRPT